MYPIQVTVLIVVLSSSFGVAITHFPSVGILETRDAKYMQVLPGKLPRGSSGEIHHTPQNANPRDREPHNSAGHIHSRSVENGRLARRTLTPEQIEAMVKKLDEEIGELKGTGKGAGTTKLQSASDVAGTSQGLTHSITESKDQKLKQLEERKPKVVKAVALLEQAGRANDAKKLQTAFSRYTKATEAAFNVFSKGSESGRKSPSSLEGGMRKGSPNSGKGKRC